MDQEAHDALELTNQWMTTAYSGKINEGAMKEEDLALRYESVKDAFKRDFDDRRDRMEPILIGAVPNKGIEGLTPIYLIDSTSNPLKSGIDGLDFPDIQWFNVRDFVPNPYDFDKRRYVRFLKSRLEPGVKDEEEVISNALNMTLKDGMYQFRSEEIRRYLPKIGIFYCSLTLPKFRHILMVRSSGKSAKGISYRSYCFAVIAAYIKRSCSDSSPVMVKYAEEKDLFPDLRDEALSDNIYDNVNHIYNRPYDGGGIYEGELLSPSFCGKIQVK